MDGGDSRPEMIGYALHEEESAVPGLHERSIKGIWPHLRIEGVEKRIDERAREKDLCGERKPRGVELAPWQMALKGEQKLDDRFREMIRVDRSVIDGPVACEIED